MVCSNYPNSVCVCVCVKLHANIADKQNAIDNVVMNNMLQHVQHILGIEIVFMLEHPDMLLESMEMHSTSIPHIQPGKSTSSKTNSLTTRTFPAMLFPRGAELYALYTDMNDTIFVRTPQRLETYFVDTRCEMDVYQVATVDIPLRSNVPVSDPNVETP